MSSPKPNAKDDPKTSSRSSIWSGAGIAIAITCVMTAQRDGWLPKSFFTTERPTESQQSQPIQPPSTPVPKLRDAQPNSKATVNLVPKPATDGVETNSAKRQKRLDYSPEFEREWGGIKGDSDFAQSYEENYKRDTGIGFNDSQKAYVRNVILEDFKARLYKIYQSLGDSVSGDQVDAALDAASADVTKEVGPIHQAKLLAMMDGEQVAKLSSFLSGINTASPQAQSKNNFSPAFEYLWTGGQGDEYIAAGIQKALESRIGVAFNELQKEYLRSTLFPECKSRAADALSKLDLSSGKVTGSDIQAAIVNTLAACFKEHSEKFFSMMDADQRRVIELRNAPEGKEK
jgi:hypothetical protein